MKNILKEIVKHKMEESAARALNIPVDVLKGYPGFETPVRSLKKALMANGASGIIAEFKRKSPSKGYINEHADVSAVTKGYQSAGASAISVLTDQFFFGARENDFDTVREIDLPILRKDFIVTEYQVYETKAMGADVMLLVAACLSKEDVLNLAKLAKTIGLELLLELHDEAEAEKVNAYIDVVGINNRNLKTFEVDLDRSARMVKMLPDHILKIAESGIQNAAEVKALSAVGFDGFLVGETFMKSNDPGMACLDFIKQITI